MNFSEHTEGPTKSSKKALFYVSLLSALQTTQQHPIIFKPVGTPHSQRVHTPSREAAKYSMLYLLVGQPHSPHCYEIPSPISSSSRPPSCTTPFPHFRHHPTDRIPMR